MLLPHHVRLAALLVQGVARKDSFKPPFRKGSVFKLPILALLTERCPRVSLLVLFPSARCLPVLVAHSELRAQPVSCPLGTFQRWRAWARCFWALHLPSWPSLSVGAQRSEPSASVSDSRARSGLSCCGNGLAT